MFKIYFKICFYCYLIIKYILNQTIFKNLLYILEYSSIIYLPYLEDNKFDCA